MTVCKKMMSTSFLIQVYSVPSHKSKSYKYSVGPRNSLDIKSKLSQNRNEKP